MRRRPSWVPRALVALTILACLGAGGYAGQAWKARRIAEEIHAAVKPGDLIGPENLPDQHYGLPSPLQPFGKVEILPIIPADYCFAWQACPPYGIWRWRTGSKIDRFWIPRRSYYEIVKRLTGLDLGNDPAAWEAWFKAHPNLIWDEELHRLVDAPPSR